MSIKIMAQVYDSHLSDIYEHSVMLALANHADDDGVCFPSMARIARLARCSERKAQGVVKALSERGYIEIQPNAGPKGCNIFRLHPYGHRTACTPHDVRPAPCAPRTPRQGPPHSVHPNRQETSRNRHSLWSRAMMCRACSRFSTQSQRRPDGRSFKAFPWTG